ncbi:LD-carboxypeptidase [Spirochaetota bacterium]
MSRILPKALKRGDTIGIIAPSGSLKDPSSVMVGASAIEAMGFKIAVGDSRRSAYGYLAASDELRAADLNTFFADSSIDGIVCLKGGYGTPRILDKIDYDIVASNPKVFAGYSDITGLHLAFRRLAAYPTFHTPMAISMEGGFDDFSAASWMKTLTSTTPLGMLVPPPGCSTEALVRGKARGPLIGGNLSLVAGLVGTPYAFVPDGAILFLEDIAEEPYRIDRMLTQLRLAGVFERCAGIVLGHWTRCDAKEPGRSLSLEQVFSDIIAPAGKPTMTGFSAGHSTPTHSLPFGVEAVLDADAGTLEIVEQALC